MCGIVGMLGGGDIPGRKELLERMTCSLVHRGPDTWGTYLGHNVALGHRRLSIIDLQGGGQPMASERLVVVFNGEIFNYIELREELRSRGRSFNTSSDTEVLLRAWEEYGPDALRRLNGQFAFLVWDRREHTLVASRDRYGIRPLYVAVHHGTTYFASEMKAFDQIPDFSREFSVPLLLEHGLLWNTLGTETVFEGVRTVEAGTFETYDSSGRFTSTRYYELGEDQSQGPDSIEEAEDDLVALLNDSVRLRLRSDVPVGNYLSGGIDSSVITYLTRKYNSRFKTFSVSFTDSAYDESRYQRLMVERIDSEHHDETIDYTEINANFLNAAYHFERPVFRTAPIPLYLLSRAVREHDIKVVLTGEAADEILYGYDTYKEIALLSAWESNADSEFAETAIRQLYPHLDYYRDPKKFGFMKMYYKSFVGAIDNPLVGLNIRMQNNSALARAMNIDVQQDRTRDRLVEKVRASLPADFTRWSLLRRNQYLEMKTLLSGYLLSSQGDRMSLAHGVEGRYPFLDHRLVERVFGYADSFKLNGLSQKHVLRRAFAERIPAEIVDRPKMPYQAPDLKSFFVDGQLTDEAESLLNNEALRHTGIFDPVFVGRLVSKYCRSMPETVGYRDNMILTFVLSSQAVKHWADHPVHVTPDRGAKTVDLRD